MKKILLILGFLTYFCFGENLCEIASEYSVYCYKLREGGKIKSCDEAVNLVKNEIKDGKLRKWAEKSCQYGCLSETLHEANQMEDFIINECKREK
jgi:predicted RNA-binding protein